MEDDRETKNTFKYCMCTRGWCPTLHKINVFYVRNYLQVPTSAVHIIHV